MNKRVWFYLDWFMIVLFVYLYVLAFPTLEQWNWGYTSKEFEVTTMFVIGYLAIRGNLK